MSDIQERADRYLSGEVLVRGCFYLGDTEQYNPTMMLEPLPVIDRAEGELAFEEANERTIKGYASITERAYPIRDRLGVYQETIARGAFQKTLESNPEVAHRIQHAGLGISTTRNGSLVLNEDENGLAFTSKVDMRQTDVQDLVYKIERGTVTQTSFAFRVKDLEIGEGRKEIRITEVDLHRGDVASVTYPGSPYTEHVVLPTKQKENSADEVEEEESQESNINRSAASFDARLAIIGYNNKY